MEDYLNGIDKNMWKSIKDGNYREYLVENIGTVGTDVDMVTRANTRKACDKKALRELRGALPPFVYNYKENKNIEAYNDRMNDLILRCNRYGIMEIAEENKLNYGGPMALVSKENVKEDEEGFLINSDDEAVSYYSNNRVKNFLKKPISGGFKNNLEKKQVSNAGGSQNDYMLQKMEEKKEKVKDKAYYAKKLEEVCAPTKNLSLVARRGDENNGTYQIWSFKYDDEEIHNPTHGVLYEGYKEGEVDEDLVEYAKAQEESDEEDEKMIGRCFVSTSPKSPLTVKVCDLLVSFNIPSNSYHSILCEFDETYSYINDLLVSMTSEAENSKAFLYEASNRIEEKKTKIKSFELYVKNIMCDKDRLRMDNKMLIK
ncbi:unnamed protein product [Lactuca saligna]|uniref:Uncharacterized protein n=1 Tax=Lactuca saligna TaxID=75948 RepID=A0AA35ZHZ3_LACSI|nr:unnamed protein product [Lactuca saligna]